MRVAFTTRDGRRVSFNAHSGKKRKTQLLMGSPKPRKPNRPRAPRTGNSDAAIRRWGYG